MFLALDLEESDYTKTVFPTSRVKQRTFFPFLDAYWAELL